MIQMIDTEWKRNLVAVGVVGAVEIARRFPSGCGKHDTCGVFSKALWTTAMTPKEKVPIGVVHRAGRRGRFHNPAGHRGRRGRRTMGIPNRDKETLDRLEHKTLDAQFVAEMRNGLGCSPFEAEAVLGVVKEVYAPYLEAAAPVSQPGKVTLLAVSADEPAGKRIADCEKRAVCLTVHRGPEDDRLMQKSPAVFRRARIPDLCQEALSQGALLTREDLAYRVFFVTPRTISRDLSTLRKEDPRAVIPLRSTVHDIGPILTHRDMIVRLALEGKTTTEICTITHHSPQAVANYLSTFARCVQLARRKMHSSQIAFLLRRGRSLIDSYLALIPECERDPNMAYHLDELLRLGASGGEKNQARSGGDNG